MSTMKWFDLSSVGMALNVLPKSMYREKPIMVLSFADRALSSEFVFKEFTGQSLKSASDELTLSAMSEQWDMVRERLTEGLKSLGFTLASPTDQSIYVADRSAIALDDLNRVFPSINALEHVVDMEKTDIVIKSLEDVGINRQTFIESEELIARQAENKLVWERFAQSTVQHWSRDVFVHKDDLSIRPWSQSPLFADFKDESISPSNPDGDALSRRTTGFNKRLTKHVAANKATRSNALIIYYASQAAAESDGQDLNDLVQVSLPYALPLLSNADQSKVMAIRDFRGMPEIYYFSPATTLNENTAHVENKMLGAQWYRQVEMPLIEPRAKAKNALDVLIGLTQATTLDSSAFMAQMDVVNGLIFDDIKGLMDAHYSAIKDSRAYDVFSEFKSFADVITCPAFNAIRYLENTLALPSGELRDQVNVFEKMKPAYLVASEQLSAQKAAEQRELEAQAAAKRLEKRNKTNSKPDLRIDDAGEKIGGARKDFAKRYMTLDDLHVMTDIERTDLVIKGNIWPALDYRQMKADGLDPKFALALKAVKDLVEAKPAYKNMAADEVKEAQQEYIEAVSMVRDAVMATSTLDELNRALFALAFEREGIEPPPVGTPIEKVHSSSIYSSSDPFDRQVGRKFCSLLNDAYDYRYRDQSGNYYENGQGVYEVDQPREIGRIIGNKMPAKRYNYLTNALNSYVEQTTDDHWGVLVKQSSKKSDAELEAQAAAKKIDEHLHRPHLEKVIREGQDWRNGLDITAEDLLNDFGFRAVEFGNWLPQDERQDVLNMAYDAFCDLAHTLNLPRKAMSLGDDLALGFGSRGTGGRKAALAHFEPARFVINLTRMNGAGSLAHEWFHAFDFAMNNKKGFLSDHPAGIYGDAMAGVVDAMRKQQQAPDSAIRLADMEAKKHAEWASNWIGNRLKHPDGITRDDSMKMYKQFCADFTARAGVIVDRMLASTKKLADETLLADPKFTVSASAFREFLLEAKLFELRKAGVEELEGIAAKVASIRKKSKAEWQVEGNLSLWSQHVEKQIKLSLIEHVKPKFVQGAVNELHNGLLKDVKSDYLQSAEKLDKTRSKPYWATTLELFARAGAAYVQDKLDAEANRCDYLVYGSEEKTYVDCEHGNPVPMGETRQRINAALDGLVAEYRREFMKTLDASVEAEADHDLSVA